MKLGSWLALTAGAVALVVVACDYPAFEFASAEGGSGATGTGSGNGGGGLTTTGTGTETGTTGTGAGSDTGTETGAPSGTGTGTGAECSNIGTQDTCGAGRKCTVVEPGGGTLGCMQAGATPDFAVCASNSDCGVSSWCDQPTGVCKPICENATTCTTTYGLPSGTLCSVTQNGGQPVLGGLLVCSAHCNPLNAYQCNQTAGAVSCMRRTDAVGDWDCVASAGGGDGDACDSGRDCAPNFACGPDGSCQPWCGNPGSCCGQCGIYTACVCAGCRILDSPGDSYDEAPLGACYGVFEEWPLTCC